MDKEEYLRLADISPDWIPHVLLSGVQKCHACSWRHCLYICPAGVFTWEEEKNCPRISWHRCLECGACEPACPEGNIKFQYPRSGFGIINHV